METWIGDLCRSHKLHYYPKDYCCWSKCTSCVSLTTPCAVSTATTDPVVQSVTRLLQAQTDAITAQAKATAVQSLPALPHYTGEGTDVTDDGFDKWIERFRERAKFAAGLRVTSCTT